MTLSLAIHGAQLASHVMMKAMIRHIRGTAPHMRWVILAGGKGTCAFLHYRLSGPAAEKVALGRALRDEPAIRESLVRMAKPSRRRIRRDLAAWWLQVEDHRQNTGRC